MKKIQKIIVALLFVFLLICESQNCFASEKTQQVNMPAVASEEGRYKYGVPQQEEKGRIDGVDVKVIIDAVEANNLHRKKHYLMRKEGIQVKSENFGGKMHCKTFLSDDKIFSFGSMNATTTAEYYNDENLVIVKNPELTKEVRAYFEQLWEQIPDKWLYSDPSPEGPDSPGSCTDGIDNDHNGLRDEEDPRCNYRVSPVYR